MDIVDRKTRSRMMSGIRSKDTRPEIIVRKLLHSAGFRYRLNVKSLPGRPDLVLPKYKAVVLINGCFWHGHDCHLFKWPSTRPDFWRSKIGGNIKRDGKNQAALRDAGWRVGIVWECALKGRQRLPESEILEKLEGWLLGPQDQFAIEGER